MDGPEAAMRTKSWYCLFRRHRPSTTSRALLRGASRASAKAAWP